MNEEYLEKIKKEYLKDQFPETGRNELKSKLGNQSHLDIPRVVHKSLLSISLLLLFFGTFIASARTAKPGQALYSVKILSDDVFSQITGKYETKIENRTQDMLDVIKKEPQSLDKATQQYFQTLEDTKDEVEKSQEQKEQFKKTLEEQEEKLKNAKDENPQLENELQDVITKTERIRGEVKGDKEKKKENENPSTKNGKDHSKND